jgi:hypothetical protein
MVHVDRQPESINQSHLLAHRGARRAMVITAFLVAVFVVAPGADVVHGQSLSVLHDFGGSNGDRPSSGLTMDAAGNLYGTTQYGGILNCDEGGVAGCGVAYRLKKVNSRWIFYLLYQFPGINNFLPTYPLDITIGPSGVPYGVTWGGGSNDAGTLFHLQPTPNGTSGANAPWLYHVDHNFGSGDDGAQPTTQVVFDPAGNIFGAAEDGGTGNLGVVYELTCSGGGWTERILYNFLGPPDGSEPHGVALDGAGNICGTTISGGNQECYHNYGCGTVYELTQTGSSWTRTILHVFEESTDGGNPGPLLRDSAGNLFGLTNVGAAGNNGSIWELSPTQNGWVFTVLYTFPAPTYEWAGPFRPVMDASGALYGVNNAGGAYSYGNIYKLAPSNGGWTYTDLYDFVGGGDGCYPRGPVALDAAGNIYGTTQFCADGGGNVWELTP